MEEHGEYWEKTQTHKMDSGGARKSADGARAGAIEKCEGERKEGRTEGMRLQGAGKKGAGGNRMVETERNGNVARSPAGLPCVGSSCKAYTRQNMEPNRESQRVGIDNEAYTKVTGKPLGEGGIIIKKHCAAKSIP